MHRQRLTEVEMRVTQNLEEKLAEGAKISPKATFLEHNEKCSKYFFNLEKKHGQDKLIKAVRDPADRLVSDTDGILREQTSTRHSIHLKTLTQTHRKKCLLI